MEINGYYRTKNEGGRETLTTYIRILDIFKPGTHQYNWEKEKLGSDFKGISGIFIKYERCDNPKFDSCYINYMKRTDFLYNFKKDLKK